MTKKAATLSAYLKRVMALKEERRRTPSEDELRSIAREIGLSDEDLAAIDQAAEDHAVRGLGFLEHQRYGDAITELEEAVGVAPRRVEWLHSLAQAYLGRWQAGGEPSDRERAEALGRECLEIDPHHGASYEVLNQLDESPGPPARAKRSAAILSAFALAMLLTVVIGGMVLWRSTEKAVATAPPPPSLESTETVETMAAEKGETKELDLPVTLDPGATGVVLGLDARLSQLKNYGSGQSFYTLNAILTNRGNEELDKLGCRLELLDAAGAVVYNESFEPLNKSTPVLRPGDAHAFHHLRETVDSARTARLVVETAEKNPAASSYAAASPLDFEWRVERASDYEIAMRERSRRFSENALSKDGSGYFNVVVEVENAGQRTIRALKLEAEIVGPEGAWTVPETNYVATSSGPALHPGEVRLERFIEKVDAKPDSYRMFVVAIE